MGGVLLVDDHQLFIEGLKYLLETHDIKVIGTANTIEESLIKIKKLKPDIILLDVMMPEVGGLEALKLIKAEMPESKIVMLTASEEDDDLFEAIKFGASGYLLKSLNGDELVKMIRMIKRGEAVLAPELVTRLLKEFKNHSKNNEERLKNREDLILKNQKLSLEQLEIVELISRGKTYKQVGDTIGISERTVKYHMGKILEKLHLENRSQVIAYASKKGLIKGYDPENR